MRGALVVRAGLLRREQGLALPIVLGMMLVFGLALGGVMTLSGSSEQSAAREKQSQTAFGAGEASLATAISQLATAANPRSSSSLPSCAAPATLAFAGSTGDYCGTLTGDDWTITARGFAKTTAAGGQQTRRITQVASILPFYHGGLGELWNRVYQWDTSKCVEFKKIILTVPVVTRSCVKLKGNSSKPTRLLGTYVSIAGYVELEDSDSIGLSSNPIARADIGGTCDLKHGSGPHSPCGPADAVYATAISTSTPDLGRPTVDFAYWYANAKPGPKFPCTVGSLPSGSEFEKAGDLAYDGDAKKMDLTPKDESYTCQHWSGGEMLGELSWNHVTKVLKVTGADLLRRRDGGQGQGARQLPGQGDDLLRREVRARGGVLRRRQRHEQLPLEHVQLGSGPEPADPRHRRARGRRQGDVQDGQGRGCLPGGRLVAGQVQDRQEGVDLLAADLRSARHQGGRLDRRPDDQPLAAEPDRPATGTAVLEPQRGLSDPAAGATRLMRLRAGRGEGQALPLTIAIMVVFGLATVSVITLTSSAQSDAERGGSQDAALAAAEAGVATALSVLSNSPRPLASTALPAPGAPQVDAVSGGTVSWYGTLAGDTWTIYATGAVPNPAGGAVLTRALQVDARVGSTAVNGAWNYVYANDASGCLTLNSSVVVSEPLYTRGSLCTNNSSRVTGSPTHVEGTIQTTSSSSVGQSGTPIAELHVAGGCRYGTSGAFVFPCTASQQVYATAQDQVPAGVTKPPVDLAFWYANAKPGPLQTCTTGSFPGGFDTDTTMNRSRANVNLFASNYDCTVTSGAAQVGRIAYTSGNPGSLIIDGTVFFDGNIVMTGSQRVLYSGRGTIYASGYIDLGGSQQICGSYSGGCNFGGWVPETAMLALVAGSTTDTPGFQIRQSARFQGGIYAAGSYSQGSSTQVQGPKIAETLSLSGSSQATWSPFTYLPPGAPMEKPLVTTGGWRG